MIDFTMIFLAQSIGAISAALETFMFLIGLWFTWKAVHAFTSKSSGDNPNQGESPWSNLFWGGIFAISGPVISVAISTVGGANHVGEANPFAYTPDAAMTTNKEVYFKEVIRSTLLVLKFFGYWFMLKGFLLLKEITDGSHGHKQHSPSFAGFTHIVFAGILIVACDNNSPLGIYLGVGTGEAPSITLSERIFEFKNAVQLPVLVAFSIAGSLFGSFYVYSGIKTLSNRSSNGQQKGSVADDFKKILGGGALASLGGVAGMTAETALRIFN